VKPVLRTIVYVFYFIIVLLFVRMVSRALGRLLGANDSGRASARPRRPVSRQAEDLVRDRICNTHVPRSRALTAVVEGHEEYFCSQACREKAQAAARRVS
jgi:YHS domain-containing protein